MFAINLGVYGFGYSSISHTVGHNPLVGRSGITGGTQGEMQNYFI